MADFIKAVLLGVIEGLTEWLPISSTGHMLLFRSVFGMSVSEEFFSLLLVVIQLFSVCAVFFIYGKRLLPHDKRLPIRLYLRIGIAAIPAAVTGFLFDDLIERYCYGTFVIAIALIVYGFLFIYIEKMNNSGTYNSAESIDNRTALKIGLFQILSLIPGTSRSGATVTGGMLSGCSRSAATEFSFLLAIPIMLGASALRLLKFTSGGNTLTGNEWLLLLVGGMTAFFVSLVTIRFLSDFVKKHSFRGFGVYRILLGIIMIILLFLGIIKA